MAIRTLREAAHAHIGQLSFMAVIRRQPWMKCLTSVLAMGKGDKYYAIICRRRYQPYGEYTRFSFARLSIISQGAAGASRNCRILRPMTYHFA